MILYNVDAANDLLCGHSDCGWSKDEDSNAGYYSFRKKHKQKLSILFLILKIYIITY